MSTIKQVVNEHPLLLGWLVLAVAMVAMLLYAAQDVAFAPSQLAALIVATIALAGACVWIISWDSDQD